MRRVPTAFVLVALMLASLGLMPPASASHLTNVGVPSSYDGLTIWISIYKPAAASSTNKVPIILHSHGWSLSRTNSETAFSDWLSNGFGVVSIDQRGHGQTGGTAHVQNPDIEGQDIISVIDYIAELDWVKRDLDENGDEIANDPVMGAIGGSYGGGYQTIAALTELRDFGYTRFNALAPEITWNSLPQSLGPQDVPRTLWNVALYAVGNLNPTRFPDYIHQSFVLGTATATFPNGEIPGTYNLKDRFYRNSPAWFAANGIHLDIPVLFGQGIDDNLFPLNEAYHNYTDVLTPEARAKSIVIGYNGGHNLPSAVPAGTTVAVPLSTSDPCSGGFSTLARNFFTKVFAGEDPTTLQPKKFNIASAGGVLSSGQCLRVDSIDTYTPTLVGPVGLIASPTTATGPISLPLVAGPVTVVGIPRLRGDLTSLGVEARAFFGLSIGATPATAQIIQNNVMPLRQLLPVVGQPLNLELAGVAIVVPAGQSLYLTVSAQSDMFFGAARTPGAFVIENAVVDLPLQ